MILFLALTCVFLGLNFSSFHIVFSIIYAVIFLLFLIIRFKKSKLLFLYLPLFLGSIAIPYINIPYNSNNNFYEGVVIDAKENYYLFYSVSEKFYIYEKESKKEVGDILSLEGYPIDLKMTSYESRFDFKSYLGNKGVKRELKVINTNNKFANPIRFKEYKTNFLNNFDDDTKLLLDSFLFFNKDYESEIYSLASSLNLVTLLSTSGIVLSPIIQGLKKLLSLKFKDKVVDIVPYILLLPYVIFLFPKVGLLRIFFIGIISYLNKYIFKRKHSYLTLISFLGLLFLLFDFHLANDLSFVLGFGLSILVYFLRPLFSKMKKKKSQWVMLGLINLYLLPYSCLGDGKLHLLNPFIQQLLIPFNIIFAIFGLISFLIYLPFIHVLPFLGKVLLKAYQLSSYLHVSIPINGIFNECVLLYHITYIILIYLLERGRKLHSFLISIPIISTFLVSLLPIKLLFINAVYFINVGQGDSIVIQNKNHAVMIDTGGNTSFDIAKDVLIPFLNKKQIYHLDALIITHNDEDHSGGVESLLANFSVDRFLDSKDDFPYRVGEIYLENLNIYDFDDENDKSLVFNLSFLNKKFLLMGDASTNVERKLLKDNIDIDADIIKIGHHGSDTSSMKDFLIKSSPYEAIISIGEKNRYGHPKYEVITRLESLGIKIRRTDLEGTISYYSFF